MVAKFTHQTVRSRWRDSQLSVTALSNLFPTELCHVVQGFPLSENVAVALEPKLKHEARCVCPVLAEEQRGCVSKRGTGLTKSVLKEDNATLKRKIS